MRFFIALLLICTGITANAQKPQLVTPVAHTSTVTATGITSDGKYLVSAGWDSKLIIWEKSSGRKIATVVLPDQVTHMAMGKYTHTAAVALQNGSFVTVDINSAKIIRQYPAYPTLVRSIDFSPLDDKIAVTASNQIDLWDTAPEGKARTYHFFKDNAVSAYITGNERILAAGDSSLLLIDPVGDSIVGSLKLDTCKVNHLWIDANSTTWLTVHETGMIRIWKLRDNEIYNPLNAPGANPGGDCFIRISPDGQYLLAKFNFNDSLRLYNLENGHTVGAYETSFLPDLNIQRNDDNFSFQNPFNFTDSAYSFTGVNTNRDLFITDTTGKIITNFGGNSTSINELFISGDDRYFMFYSFNDNQVKKWDLKNNSVKTIFDYLDIKDLSPDGKTLMAESDSGRIAFYDFNSHELLRKIPMGTEGIDVLKFSPDGNFGYSCYFSNQAFKHDLKTGKLLQEYKTGESDFGALAISPDGKWLVTAAKNGDIIIWNEAAATIRYTLKGLTYVAENLVFTKDSRYLISGSASSWMHCRSDQDFIVWDLTTGKEVRRISTGGTCMRKVILSPDEKKLIGASDAGGQIYIWDFATGKLEKIIEGHSSFVSTVSFTHNGRFLVSGSIDNSIALWDVNTWQLKTRLVPFEQNNWLAASDDGLFDASPDIMNQMYYVVSDSTNTDYPWVVIDFNQLKHRYYQPGLLPIITGFSNESLREVPKLDRLEMAPEVLYSLEKKRLWINLTNKGGGFGKVSVFLNNAEIIEDAITYTKAKGSDKEIGMEIDLNQFNRLINDGEVNKIKILAYNKDNWLSSRPMELSFKAPAAAKGGQVGAVKKTTAAAKPHFYALICGTSDYSGTSIDLKYAAKDAQDFAHAIELAAIKLFGPKNVHITLLNSESTDAAKKPVKKNFLNAFKMADSSNKDDVFLVYLSGHGVNYGGQDGDFYYLFAQAAGSDAAYLNDPQVRTELTMSSNELTRLFNEKKAGKKILILDACASGKAAENMAFAMRDVPASQVRALDRMADRTGFYVLSGSAADAVSYETSVYGQGLLTYSLLKAIRGAALRKDGMEEYVDIQKMLQFTVDDVPVLAKGIGGIQQPLYRSPGDQKSFDIGMVDNTIKNQIVLSEPKPVFVASSFINEARKRDDLKLSDLINGQLQEITAKGKTAELLFIEAKDYPNSWELSGTYKIEGDTITADCLLFRNEQEKTFSVKGSKADLPGLVASMLTEVKKLIR